jgi:hypothetical protein
VQLGERTAKARLRSLIKAIHAQLKIAAEARDSLEQSFMAALSRAATTLDVEPGEGIDVLVEKVRAKQSAVAKDYELNFTRVMSEASPFVEVALNSLFITVAKRRPGVLLSDYRTNPEEFSHWFRNERERLQQAVKQNIDTVETTKGDIIDVLSKLVRNIFYTQFDRYPPNLDRKSDVDTVRTWASEREKSYAKGATSAAELHFETSTAREETLGNIIRGIHDFAHGIFDVTGVAKSNWPSHSEFDPIIASAALDFMTGRLRALTAGVEGQRQADQATNAAFLVKVVETLTDLLGVADEEQSPWQPSFTDYEAWMIVQQHKIEKRIRLSKDGARESTHALRKLLIGVDKTFVALFEKNNVQKPSWESVSTANIDAAIGFFARLPTTFALSLSRETNDILRLRQELRETQKYRSATLHACFRMLQCVYDCMRIDTSNINLVSSYILWCPLG